MSEDRVPDAALRASLAAVARVKADAAAEDAAEHQAIPLAERLARVLRLSDEMLKLLPPSPDAVDDEVDVWRRVNERLRAGR